MAGSAITNETPYAGDTLYDSPLDRAMAERHLLHGMRAVIVHQGEDWPNGRWCRNCHARFPCRLAAWGKCVLDAAGWRSNDVAHLLERAKAGEVPW